MCAPRHKHLDSSEALSAFDVAPNLPTPVDTYLAATVQQSKHLIRPEHHSSRCADSVLAEQTQRAMTCAADQN